MKRLKAEDKLPEVKCHGTGFPKVKQPVQPGRRIYPAPCKECAGKGRVASPRTWRGGRSNSSCRQAPWREHWGSQTGETTI